MRRKNVRRLKLWATGLCLLMACNLHATHGEMFTEKKLKTEKKSLFERDREKENETSLKSLFTADNADISKEDEIEAYAPPPGEEGNPQKVTPVGNQDWLCCLLLACLSIFIIRKKKQDINIPYHDKSPT